MPKIIALDIGGRRTGVAITDELQIIASGLTTVETSNLMDFLQDLLKQEDVETIVIGLPTGLDGKKTDATPIVEKLSKQIEQQFPNQKIAFVDERFTSAIAQQAILDGGARKKQRQDKSLIDKVSAVVILQTYLEQNS